MQIITDDIKYAENYFQADEWPEYLSGQVDNLSDLVAGLFEDKQIYTATVTGVDEFQYLFIVKKANQSHYDLIIDFCKQGRDLPHGVLCLAGSSDQLHGFKNRKWTGLEGNIHLVAYFKPDQEIYKFGPGFMALAAVSAVQAIDSLGSLNGRAMIKWVNDIMIDHAKVCGVLAYSQSEGMKVTDTVIGIGMNVEKKPSIDPTPFVPEATCLAEQVINSETCNQSLILGRLLKSMAINYNLLISGDYSQILELYRNRSQVVGREVNIYPDREQFDDSEIIGGIVSHIGDNLELFLEGNPEPVTKGRLELKRA